MTESLNTPSPSGDEQRVEMIARVIEPWSWAQKDRAAGGYTTLGIEEHITTSLAKARAILALLPVVGEREALIYTICPFIREWSCGEEIDPTCDKCPAIVATEYGDGVQACRRSAEKCADAVLAALHALAQPQQQREDVQPVAWTVRKANFDTEYPVESQFEVLCPDGKWRGVVAVNVDDARCTIMQQWTEEQPVPPPLPDSAGAGGVERDDFRWLIEAPGQRYLAVQRLHMSDNFEWTTDHDKAIAFRSEEQADALMMAVRQMDRELCNVRTGVDKHGLFSFEATLGNAWAREHGWLARSPHSGKSDGREG